MPKTPNAGCSRKLPCPWLLQGDLLPPACCPGLSFLPPQAAAHPASPGAAASPLLSPTTSPPRLLPLLCSVPHSASPCSCQSCISCSTRCCWALGFVCTWMKEGEEQLSRCRWLGSCHCCFQALPGFWLGLRGSWQGRAEAAAAPVSSCHWHCQGAFSSSRLLPPELGLSHGRQPRH